MTGEVAVPNRPDAGPDAERGTEPVEIVIFDAGLTLVRADPSFVGVFAAGLRRAGLDVDPDDIDDWGEAFYTAWQDHDVAWDDADEPSPHLGDLDVERRFWRGLYQRVLENLGIEGDHPEIAGHVHDAYLEPDNWTLYPEVPDVLDQLERHGVRTALLSNWGPSLREILEHLGVLDRFEHVVISGEIGVAKPDLAIFDRTLDLLGELPGPHAAYVGDDLEHDVVPARRIGLRAILVDRRDRTPDHDGPRVTDLRDLTEVVPLADRADG